eukprot:scaffold29590_cov36-Phaeocystis_antarctica.AAC.3
MLKENSSQRAERSASGASAGGRATILAFPPRRRLRTALTLRSSTMTDEVPLVFTPAAAAIDRETRGLDHYLTCRTRFKTAIAAARPFLGLCPSPLLWLKAPDALYNFPAARKVVGGKPGAR